MQVAWFLRDRLGMLEECQRRYGDVFTVRFPWQTLVFVADPALVREIFTGNPEVLHAGRGNEVLRPLLGDSSLLLLDGAEHLRQRRLLLPPFHGQRMRAYGELIRDLTLETIAAWPRGRPFPVLPDMQEITLSVISRCLPTPTFGRLPGRSLWRLRTGPGSSCGASSGSFLARSPRG